VGAVAVNVCVRGVTAQAGLLLGCLVQEHERAAGAWQAEWLAISEAFRLAAGAVDRTREMLDGLEVHPERMRRNLEQTGGLILSEHLAMMLAERLGRPSARQLVDAAAATAASTGRLFREVLLTEPAITRHVAPADIEAALDPAGYLGSADALVERALAAYRTEGAKL
jgi:3-carboxy-cis,cis-muconate cycloisomerase